MAKGIKLKLDGGEFVVESQPANEPSTKSLACFGGVICDWMEHRPSEFKLFDGKTIPTVGWFCGKAQKSIIEIENTTGKCPLKLWQKMAVPIGWHRRFDEF